MGNFGFETIAPKEVKIRILGTLEQLIHQLSGSIKKASDYSGMSVQTVYKHKRNNTLHEVFVAEVNGEVKTLVGTDNLGRKAGKND